MIVYVKLIIVTNVICPSVW